MLALWSQTILKTKLWSKPKGYTRLGNSYVKCVSFNLKLYGLSMDLEQMQVNLVLTKLQQQSCIYKCAVAFYLSFLRQ